MSENKSAPTTASCTNNASQSWIHCNACFEIYMKKQRKFYFLACNHVVCEKCVTVCTTQEPYYYKCAVNNCDKNVLGRLLSNALPPHFKELFHPQPWQDDMPAGRIMKFQAKHMQQLLQKQNKTLNNLCKMQPQLEMIRQAGKKKFEELEQFRRERNHLERRIIQINKMCKRIEQKRCDKPLNNVTKASTTADSGITSVSSQHTNTSHNFGLAATRSCSTNKRLSSSYSANKSGFNATTNIHSFVHKQNQSFNL